MQIKMEAYVEVLQRELINICSGCERRQAITYSTSSTFVTKEKTQILTDDFDFFHAVRTLPSNVCLKKSVIPKTRFGIWSTKEIPKGVRFGPYEGNILYDEDKADESPYSWMLMKVGLVDCFVDARDEYESNWVRYINFAPQQTLQNLIAVKCGGQIYFQTDRMIPPNKELLVWYGFNYEAEFKIGLFKGGSKDNVADNCAFIEKDKFTLNHEMTEKIDNIVLSSDLKQILKVNVNNEQKVGESSNTIIIISLNKNLQNNVQIQNSVGANAEKKCFHCKICDKTFESKMNLQLHQLKHVKEKHSCELCDKEFTWSSSLRNHRLTHTGEKPFVCDVCDKKFTRKSGLKLHKQRIHAEENPFICGLCGKRFINSYKMKMHHSIHIGQKPHVCDICNKGFVQQHQLKRHKRIHMKSYICDLCGKRFAELPDLDCHKCKHKGERPYVCDVCGRRYKTNPHLKRHRHLHSRHTISSM